ncbi:hypothetical protein Cantr_09987 [Candida viswanathii]|uniref:RNase III domain-containing protein n=1 Tax=Candida viswanathii TaxID=5486 RepID=A0A367YEQ5_9ASCO|nr:hypothetical protein Cantr_09987 [Candida viswanathii]
MTVSDKDINLILSNLNRSIFSMTPTAKEWDQLLLAGNDKKNKDRTRIREITNSPYGIIVVRLRELCGGGKLPLLEMLSQLTLKASNDYDAADFLMSYNPEIDETEVNSAVGLAFRRKKSNFLKQDAYSYPPILPKIQSKALIIPICTDKSYRRVEDLMAPEATTGFYLSRAILKESGFGLPDLEVEAISHKLLSNTILTKFAFGYNLVDCAKYDLSADANFEEKLDILGNLFLAYIGGLGQESYSMDLLKKFVKQLYGPVINDYLEKFDPLATVGLLELDLVLKSRTNLKYAPHKNFVYGVREIKKDPHVAQILVDGIELATGVSFKSFNDAKCGAANSVFHRSGDGVHRILQLLAANGEENSRNKETVLQSVTVISNLPQNFATTSPLHLPHARSY